MHVSGDGLNDVVKRCMRSIFIVEWLRKLKEEGRHFAISVEFVGPSPPMSIDIFYGSIYHGI